VLDFRDGLSRQKFSSSSTIMDIAEKAGGVVSKHTNDFTKAFNLLEQVESGKEYYFTCEKHAAIVGKTTTGYEYLELQSPIENRFKSLTTDELKKRFGAKKSHSLYGTKYETKDCIIDIELLKKDASFRKLLGYIKHKKVSRKKVQLVQLNKLLSSIFKEIAPIRIFFIENILFIIAQVVWIILK
jgi:hypothetical protein